MSLLSNLLAPDRLDPSCAAALAAATDAIFSADHPAEDPYATLYAAVLGTPNPAMAQSVYTSCVRLLVQFDSGDPESTLLETAQSLASYALSNMWGIEEPEVLSRAEQIVGDLVSGQLPTPDEDGHFDAADDLILAGQLVFAFSAALTVTRPYDDLGDAIRHL